LFSAVLTKIIIDEPNNLFHYCNIDIRLITIHRKKLTWLKSCFDSYRLGEISNNITLAEPIFRDADVVSLDLNLIKSSDSGNFISFA
jgi:hypothetical protein